MKTVRIIPRLDIKGPNLVKGIHLEGLRVLGKPEDFAQYYYENGADELIYQDVVASLYERNSLKDIISATAKNIFIPLTVGGGIRTQEDIKEILRAGADKVSINTAAVKNPTFIQQASRRFGSSTIVVAIEAIRQPDGKYFIFTDNGREYTGIDAIEWAAQVESLGAGELSVTSVDNEGTGKGLDLELVKRISDSVSIPVIAHGGIGSAKHMAEANVKCSVDAFAVSSILHYDFIKQALHNRAYETEGNIDFLLSGRTKGNIETIGIPDLKNYLNREGISCRV
ncbi:imidazole glycerol phosphate synthase cyclase subunit [Pontibacter sp. E15-1]|uniref:imidazole glycerol phosphate synthase subunit HisF n=1 Tax=Pontibacter sp. E15-1 TaxID=2919918 RepID=UPI001F5001C6|nr:imidazole glycerol phosphate synthase cyclase subunit [Pontibacter sp. E15-1]MCJ8166419.1 imidazole glycerol phosphate synthase cyclase subunit [Pontibacter sp. E15-1]